VPFSFALKTDDDCFVDLENILQVSKFYQLHLVGRQRSRVYKRASQTVAIMYAENRRTLGSGHSHLIATACGYKVRLFSAYLIATACDYIRYAENKRTL
jgi:hypothetical protein